MLLEPQGWTPGSIQEAIATGTLRRVQLDKPVPVLLYYWTVAVEDDGDVLFRSDVYGRDAAILKALAQSSAASRTPGRS